MRILKNRFSNGSDGVVNVSAQDLGTGQSQGIELAVSSGLSTEEVERLVEEAEQHTAADSALRALTECRNKAEGLIYSTEKMLEEFSEDITEEDRDRVEGALSTAREQMKADDEAALRHALDELSAVTYQVTEALYTRLEALPETMGLD